MGLLTGPLINISTDQMATPVDSADGGIGQKFVTSTIKRLVAGEIVNVYFITEPSSPWVDQKPSIRVIKFNSGMGRTGLPILFFWVPPVLLFTVLTGITIVGINYWARRERQSFNDRLREAIQLGASARQEGVAAEQLNTRVENFHQVLPFYRRPWKDTLIACAQAAFTEVRQEDKLKP
jgi:hypothetical protein